MKILNLPRLAVWVYPLAIMVQMNSVLAGTASDHTQKAPSPLSDFIVSIMADHPDLLAAKADVRSAKAKLRASAQAVYNPQLEFEYEDTNVSTKSIGISQTIDWGDQQGSRTAVAQAELHRAIANYDMAILSFINKILTALAQHQTGNELVELSSETLRLMQEFRQIAERRYQAGDLNQVELNLALLAYNQALMEQANTLSDAVEARENLRAKLAALPNILPDLPDTMPEPVLENDLETFLQQLPVIRSQLAATQVTRQKVILRKSENAWNPTIGVSAGSEDDESLIGINLSIPLNIRNNYSAEVDAAQQNLVASEQRAHLAYRNTRARLIVITERYRHLLKAWNSWRLHSRKNVEQQLKLIKRLWQAGDMSTTDYLLQLKQALETQATGLELRNQLWRVAFDWMSLTASIDNWLNINLESLGKN